MILALWIALLTSRDFEVVDFLNYYKVATASTIETMIYKSKRVCQRRLKALYDAKKVNRMRSDLNSEYIYYLKLPKQWKHCLCVTEFMKDFSNKYKIEKFILTPDFKTIIPDAMISYYNEKNQLCIALLELERANKGFDYNKYERFSMSQSYKSVGLPFMPPVFVVTKAKTINSSSNVKFIKYDLEPYM